MKFKNLPEEAKRIAVHTLNELLVNNASSANEAKEGEKALAEKVAVAFNALYEDGMEEDVKKAEDAILGRVKDIPIISAGAMNCEESDRLIKAISYMHEKRTENINFIKKSFLSWNAVNGVLRGISCCEKTMSHSGVFQIEASHSEVKCICTDCFRVHVFYVPYILNGAFDGDYIRQN